MSVRSRDLETPERGALNLVTREADDGPRKRADEVSELAAFRERIAVAKDLKPGVAQLHCADCFQRGRDAAIRTIEGHETS